MQVLVDEGAMVARSGRGVYITPVSKPTILDLRGLKCPLPVLQTRRALRRLPPGREIVVLSTDPLAGLDIPHMAAEDGYKLLRQWREGEASAFHLAKGAN